MTAPAQTASDTPVILCFSRAYLAHLLPQLAKQGDQLIFRHIVQTEAERRTVEAGGGEVVLVIETEMRRLMTGPNPPLWEEPEDFRAVSDFPWDPLLVDRHLVAFPPEKRAQVAGALQAMFTALFDRMRVDGFLSEPVALFPTHLLKYLTEAHGGLPLLWANSFWPGWMFFADRIHLGSCKRLAPRPEGDDAKLREAITAYVNRIAEDAAGPVYLHNFVAKPTQPGLRDRKARKEGASALVIAPGLRGVAAQAYHYLRTSMAAVRFPARGDYMTAASPPEHLFYLKARLARQSKYDAMPKDYSIDNVFFPLQYEPEASLLYSAPDMRDQLALIESIAQGLPQGKVLWIKEHPNQFGVLAAPRWQRLRKQYDNLRFIWGRENGRALIHGSGLCVAITSQAGIDAMIFGRKTLLLGEVFYRGFAGSVPLTGGVPELIRALNDPSNYGVFEGHKEDIIEDLMNSFARSAYPGDPQPADVLYTPENMAALYHAVTSETLAHRAAAGGPDA